MGGARNIARHAEGHERGLSPSKGTAPYSQNPIGTIGGIRSMFRALDLTPTGDHIPSLLFLAREEFQSPDTTQACQGTSRIDAAPMRSNLPHSHLLAIRARTMSWKLK